MVNPINSPFTNAEPLTGDTSRSLGAGVGDPLERSAREAAEGLRTAARSTGRSMRERMNAFSDLTDRSLANSRTYVREHPLKSTAFAMAAGMLLRGMVARRRTRH